MIIKMTTISKRQRACFHIYKKQKFAKPFYIQKSRHFSKSKSISVTFLYTKSKTLYVTQFLINFLKLVLLYKKHHTLCCVTYSYTKRKTLRKKQDSLRYIFTYKNLATLRYAIFH